MSPELILASASPRRQELIQLLGRPFQIMTAMVDESSVHDSDPAVDVVETARLKALAVATIAPSRAVIIAADTTVVLDGQRLNKPADAGEAYQMLVKLRGRIHQVYTGIFVANLASGQSVTDVAVMDVPMRAYTDAEIAAYVATGDPLDKAGAYAIQNPGFKPVAGLSACFAGVVGLPLCHLVRSLNKVGVSTSVDIAADCQAFHEYNCPIYQNILEN